MEKLEIVRSAFAIVRDALIIVLFVVLILLALTVTTFIGSIDPSQLSCENLANSVMSGDFSVITGSGTVEQQFEPTEKMLELMNEIETAAMAGNKETALSKLDELKSRCSQREMFEAVDKIEELKKAVQNENYVKALGIGSQLKKMFGQQ